MAKKKSKPKTEDEIDAETFLALAEAPAGFRRAKVDYDAVLEEIENRCLSASKIGEIMLAHSTEKEQVYYSEVTGFLGRLQKRGYVVEKRAGGVIYYRVSKAEEESEAES